MCIYIYRERERSCTATQNTEECAHAPPMHARANPRLPGAHCFVGAIYCLMQAEYEYG